MTDALRAALEPLLPYKFVRPEHLVLAVTHRSLSPELPNNETLEFLGDAVLGLAISDLLMHRFPQAREGDLSKRRAGLVAAVEAQFGADVAEELSAGQEDWKTRLQEVCQRRWRETPAYTLVEESGPDHAKRFVSELTIRGELRGRGVGHSKKAAEQAAAREALAALSALGET
jgi:ribonuclease-3